MEYHLDGWLKPLPEKPGIFRKHTTSAAELYVAQLLLDAEHPCPHIVRVFNVTSSYYDTELLTVPDSPMENSSVWNTEACRSALADAKRWLHGHNVVYFDWHGGNVGISPSTGAIQLFDFDSVGVFNTVDGLRWRFPPDKSMWSWRTYKDKYCHPCNVDDYIFAHHVLGVKTQRKQAWIKWILLVGGSFAVGSCLIYSTSFCSG